MFGAPSGAPVYIRRTAEAQDVSTVTLRDLTKTYGTDLAIDHVSLDIGAGEFVVFVGPSGCGKSTLLRMIAGLEDIDGGTLSIGGRSVHDVPAAKRGVSMVFQSYALFPHMTVYKNIGFGLQLNGRPRAEVEERVTRAAKILQIDHLLDRFPRQLSGGQRQRVAIGRAIVREPEVFLFDEPLSNLDAALRGETRLEIAKLHRTLGVTIIYVTHDQVEAMTLADRIVVLRAGKVEQVGTPSEIYARPISRFVAEFIGAPSMNLLPGRVEKETLWLGDVALVSSLPAPEGQVDIGIRPEALKIDPAGNLRLEVDAVEDLGGSVIAHGLCVGMGTPNGLRVSFVCEPRQGLTRQSVGETVTLSLESVPTLFNSETGRRIDF